MTWRAAFGASALLVLVLYAVFFHTYETKTSSVGDEHAAVEKLWKNRDAAAAYAAFKAMHEGEDITKTHPAAHIFGEVLYEKEGLDGFSVCDSSFGFGCFHSFIGKAIAEHGIDAIRRFDEICVSVYGEAGLGCVHGIGHGTLAYYGYSDEALKNSLTACDTLSWKHPYGGCRDGVFMEYNFRLMQGDAERANRAYSYQRRHTPCDVVPASAVLSCYFAQPAWWGSSLHTEKNAGSTMLSYCKEVSVRSGMEACVRGIGYAQAPGGDFEAAAGIVYCDGLGGSERERVLCREGYAWALWSTPSSRENSKSVCHEGLGETSAASCEAEYLFSIQ
jgi:hypothetical protein